MRFLLAALAAVMVFAMLPVSQATAQTDGPARFDVTKVTPSVVGPDSPGEVVVSGTLTNTGDEAITDLEGRVEAGNPATSEPQVERYLRDGPPSSRGPGFTELPGRVEPGSSLPVQIRVPLDSLQINQPGVYPLLININGSADGRTRIADQKFLLPVTGLPGAPAPPPAEPTPTSMIVPIVDRPRMEREALPQGRAVLVDDQLSTELAPGGRLYELVQGIIDGTPPGSTLGNSLCFAIDPDLLITAKAMQGGYQVRKPDGRLVEGIGRNAADLWLTKLRQAVSGRCVIALPYADADLVALGRAGLPDLVRGALDGADLLAAKDGLDAEPRDVLWPIEGALSGPLSEDLPKTTLLDTRAVDIPPGSLSPVRLRGQDRAAVPIDPLLSSALDPNRDTAQEVTATSPGTDEGTTTAQDALGALTFRATQGFIGNSTSVMVPPRRWQMTGEDLTALLSGMQQLADAKIIDPTPLPQPDPEKLPVADLTYPVQASSSEIPRDVVDRMAAQNYKVGDLARSSSPEFANPVPPGRVTTPLRNGLLHAVSSAWRDNPAAASDWVRRGTRPIRDVLGMVRIEEFPGRTTRTESDSPIPVTVVNDLPFTVGIEFHIPKVPGVTVHHDFGGQLATVPANGRRQFMLQADAQRSGQFFLDVRLTAEGGTQLGTPKRLLMESTNYGAMIPWLTGIAGAVLVLMSVRRIVKKAKGRRERRAAEQPSDPDSETTAELLTVPPRIAQWSTTDRDRDQS
ncbi:DUF6049 family protein [Saccharopolyspora griseoalba]|uniref:DUF6049 family protein n=1 Tax=Saccharopolyspora griseoalba TaxID=1431848 RepID=A0ABW2LLX9_9PSEU